MRQTPGRILAGGTPMAPLVGNLSNSVDRPVVDRTGVSANGQKAERFAKQAPIA